MKMGDKRISDIFNARSRFLRSAHLERDFHDPDALEGYVQTEFIRECCERLSDGLREKSARRAWRVTGDYGSGKSSFALFVANALAGQENTSSPKIVRAFDFKKNARPSFVPVLVTCAREPLAYLLLSALHDTVCSLYRRGANAKPAERLQRLLRRRDQPSDEDILNAIVETNSQIIADSKGQGLLIIIDELGKFLEFAALHPHRQDVFLLQRLAWC